MAGFENFDIEVKVIDQATQSLKTILGALEDIRKVMHDISKIKLGFNINARTLNALTNTYNRLHKIDVKKLKFGDIDPNKQPFVIPDIKKDALNFGDYLKKMEGSVAKFKEEASELKKVKVPDLGFKQLSEKIDEVNDKKKTIVKGKGATDLPDIGDTVDDKENKVEKTTRSFIKLKDIISNFKNSLSSASKVMKSFALAGLGKLGNSLAITGRKFKGFIKSIGRIVLYRTIRKLMAEIAKSFTASVQQLAKFDSSMNGTMSRLVTAIDKLKYSMSLIFRPLIDIITPVVEGVADFISGIANEMSRIYAIQQGLTEYTKLNSEYMKDYLSSLSKASSKFGFDKFNALSGSSASVGDIYQKESINQMETLSEGQRGFVSTLTDLFDLFKYTIDRIKPLIEPAIKVVGRVLDEIEPILEPLVGNVGSVAEIVINLFDFLSEILRPLFVSIAVLLELIEPLLRKIAGGTKEMGSKFAESFAKTFWNIISSLLKIPSIREKTSGVMQSFSEGLKKFFSKINPIKNEVTTGTLNAVMSGRDYAAIVPQQVETNITIDFENVDDSVIASELAKPMADAFRKQNIRVRGA